MAQKLYILGVGPGDPDLITVKAVRILQNADQVFIPVSRQGRQSLAFKIIEQHVTQDTVVTELLFPMTGRQNAVQRPGPKRYLLRLMSIPQYGQRCMKQGSPWTSAILRPHRG